jgi:hypothetical protein
MTTLHALAAECDAVNRANGFDVPTFDNLPGKIAMVFTELNEADDEQDNGEAAVHEEIADAAVRVLSTLHAVWGEDWADRATHFRHVYCRTAYAPIETLLKPTFKQLCLALEAWRREQRVDARLALEMAVLELYRMSDRMGFDLTAEIRRKVEINRGRGALHGKVRSLG